MPSALVGNPVDQGFGSGGLMLTQGFGSTAPSVLVGNPIDQGFGLGGLLVLQGFGATILPPNLMAAIQAMAMADATLAGIVGGFQRGNLAAGSTAPSYCMFCRAGSTPNAWTSTSEWKNEHVRFRVYATDGDTAEALGEQLIASVKAWGALDYQNGYAIPLIEVGALSEPTSNRRTGDKAAWYVEATFNARCRRGRDS
jgi:hypothetical protein